MSELETALTELVVSLKGAGQFAVDRSPEVVQQMLSYALMCDVVGIIVCLAIIVGNLFLLKRCIREYKENGICDRSEPWETVAPVWIVISTGACMALTAVALVSITKIVFYPELYIVDYVARMVSGS